MSRDYLLAKRLQDEYNKEMQAPRSLDDANNVRSKREAKSDDLNSTTNLVHPDWEVIDPTPDIHTMFGAFDQKFFQGRLQCVLLEWSKRMYSCAGICYSRKNNLGMQCTIRLSEPLLKLRSRKNLVETLLHEMIHAYLFIQNIREENGGHGPNFKRIMAGINRSAGTNITVYHTFSDEVDLYKTHWWRCNGLCQHRRPFFGYVRRTCNRAPSANDRWWSQHQQSCGGIFEKIKEPEPKRKKTSTSTRKGTPKPTPANNNTSIRKYFPGTSGSVRGGVSNRGGNTVVMRKPPQTATSTSPIVLDESPIKKQKTSSHGNLANVFGLSDLTSPGNDSPKRSPSVANVFAGAGHTLSHSTPQSTRTRTEAITPESVRNSIRDIWNNRFKPTESNPAPILTVSSESSNVKSEPKSNIIATQLDDDIVMYEPRYSIVNVADSDDDEVESVKADIKPALSAEDRQNSILQDIRGTSGDDDIQLIDDDYDDNYILDGFVNTDSTAVDDLFGENTGLQASSTNADVVCVDYSQITCPICQAKMPRDDLFSHLEGCQGVQIKIAKPSKAKLAAMSSDIGKRKKAQPKIKTPFGYSTPTSRATEMKRVLLEGGYKECEIRGILETEFDSRTIEDAIGPRVVAPPEAFIDLQETPAPPRQQESVNCPVCNQPQTGDINAHLDLCLS